MESEAAQDFPVAIGKCDVFDRWLGAALIVCCRGECQERCDAGKNDAKVVKVGHAFEQLSERGHRSPESIDKCEISAESKRSLQYEQSPHKQREKVAKYRYEPIEALKQPGNPVSLVAGGKIIAELVIENMHGPLQELEVFHHPKGAERLGQNGQNRTFLFSFLDSQLLDFFTEQSAGNSSDGNNRRQKHKSLPGKIDKNKGQGGQKHGLVSDRLNQRQ